jgi:hypothetical protein
MVSIAAAVAAFFKIILTFLGLQNREADRQAGRDEVTAKTNAKTVEKQDAMASVARPSDDAVADSLRSTKF